MPATLPTHPMAVLPLKLWRPHRFDGVALVAGAAGPDMAYPLDGLGVTIPSHTWPGALLFSLPAALVVARLIRLGAPVVAADAPDLPVLRWFAVRDYGVLGVVRHRWWVTVLSALLGVASHVLWDLVTHPGPVEAWRHVRTASDLAGMVGAVLLARHVARHRLLRRWHGDPPPVSSDRRVFLAVAVPLGLLGLLVTPPLSWEQGVHVLVTRWFACVFLAALLAAAASSAVARRTTVP